MSHVLKHIKRLSTQINVGMKHCLRVGNTLKDYLDTIFFFAVEVFFNLLQEVPSNIKRIINLDKLRIPNIRRT